VLLLAAAKRNFDVLLLCTSCDAVALQAMMKTKRLSGQPASANQSVSNSPTAAAAKTGKHNLRSKRRLTPRAELLLAFFAIQSAMCVFFALQVTSLNEALEFNFRDMTKDQGSSVAYAYGGTPSKFESVSAICMIITLTTVCAVHHTERACHTGRQQCCQLHMRYSARLA
jgi:hypothetical protein